MADNITLNSGTGGDTLAADDVAGVKYQITKITIGADGAAGSLIVGGTGTDSAGVQRVSLATDVPLPAGTNAIGKLAANSGVDIGDVDVTSCALPTGASTAANQTTIIGHLDGVEGLLTTIDADTSALAGAVSGTEMQVDVVAALPAGTNLLGRVSASLETGTIYQGTTAKTPVFVAIDAASSGDNTLVAAAGASNKIRVHQLFLVSAGTVNVRFESGAGGTALTGQMNLVANTGFVLPFSPIGWFETAADTLLNLELSGAVSVDGSLAYTVVT